MRIAIISPGYPPVRGGVEGHVSALATRLAADGHHVEVFAGQRGLRRTHTESAPGTPTVHRYPAWRTRSLSASPRLLLGVLAHRRRFDVLHVHSFHATSGFAAALGGSVPVVLTPHFHGDGHTALARLLHRCYALAGRRAVLSAKRIICVSDSERSDLIGTFPEVAGRVEIVPNGVDVAPIAAAPALEGEPLTVVGVGRFEPYKRFDLLLEAITDVPGAQLVLIGDGSQRDALVRQASDLGVLHRVRILSGLSDEAVHRWLKTAAVLVSMSEREAFGMAPMEAAAAGARLVLSDIPAHRDLLRRYLDSSATLVAHDRRALVRALVAELAESTTGRRVVDVPSWDEVTAQTAEVYRAVTGAAPTPAAPTSHRAAAERRMDLLDRQWPDHWSALLVGPIAAPTAEQLRDLLRRHLERYPDSVLGSRLDFDRGTWRSTAPSARERLLRELVVAGPDPIAGCEDEHLLTHRASQDWDLPVKIVTGDTSMVISLCHTTGDATTFSSLAFALATLDADGLEALERRATFAGIAVAAARTARTQAAGWIGQARSRQGDAVPATTGYRHTEHTPRPGLVNTTISNAEFRALTKWRNQQYGGVSLSAVLTSALYRALTEQGVAVDGSGHNLLIDTRRYLETPQPQLGNLAKSLFVRADLSDPAAIFEAQGRILDSGWALPSLLIGSVMAARRGRHRGTDRHDGPVTLDFSLMPSLPGLSALPWLAGERRYIGAGYPTSSNGISVFGIRLREHLELAASFDAATIPPEAVHAALRSLADVPRLFAAEQSVPVLPVARV